jgi:hypothetical protein
MWSYKRRVREGLIMMLLRLLLFSEFVCCISQEAFAGGACSKSRRERERKEHAAQQAAAATGATAVELAEAQKEIESLEAQLRAVQEREKCEMDDVASGSGVVSVCADAASQAVAASADVASGPDVLCVHADVARQAEPEISGASVDATDSSLVAEVKNEKGATNTSGAGYRRMSEPTEILWIKYLMKICDVVPKHQEIKDPKAFWQTDEYRDGEGHSLRRSRSGHEYMYDSEEEKWVKLGFPDEFEVAIRQTSEPSSSIAAGSSFASSSRAVGLSNLKDDHHVSSPEIDDDFGSNFPGRSILDRRPLRVTFEEDSDGDLTVLEWAGTDDANCPLPSDYGSL